MDWTFWAHRWWFGCWQLLSWAGGGAADSAAEAHSSAQDAALPRLRGGRVGADREASRRAEPQQRTGTCSVWADGHDGWAMGDCHTQQRWAISTVPRPWAMATATATAWWSARRVPCIVATATMALPVPFPRASVVYLSIHARRNGAATDRRSVPAFRLRYRANGDAMASRGQRCFAWLRCVLPFAAVRSLVGLTQLSICLPRPARAQGRTAAPAPS